MWDEKANLGSNPLEMIIILYAKNELYTYRCNYFDANIWCCSWSCCSCCLLIMMMIMVVISHNDPIIVLEEASQSCVQYILWSLTVSD